MTGTLSTSLPVVPLRTAVLLPGEASPLDIGRAASRSAIDAALASEGRLLLIPQVDPTDPDIAPDKLRAIGVEAEILQASPVAAERYMLLVRGLRRARVENYVQREPHLTASFEVIEDTEASDTASIEMKVRDLVDVLIEGESQNPDMVKGRLADIKRPGALADFAAGCVELSLEQRIELLEQPDPAVRLTLLLTHLERRAEVLRVTEDIREQMEVSEEDRDAVLRARMRAIQAELGEDAEDASPEIDELEQQVALADMSEEAGDAARKQLRRLRQMQPGAPEYAQTRTYVDWLLAIPWNERSEDRLDVGAARVVLDADHDGLEDVKKRVLQFIAVRQLAPDKNSPILCLVGPPGVGKTSLGRSIARALERKYVRISLGGVQDESEIRGHRRTYVGSLPGRIVTALKKAETINPVFVLDEIDKVGSGAQGDPSAALLEVLDPEQNSAFVDHYLEVPVDLSKVMFIATANRIDTIPAPLLDRMEVIQIPGYTEREKRTIAENHLIPRQLDEHGLSAESVELSDKAVGEIIEHYTREAGVRNLEREIASVARHVAVHAASDADWTHEYVSEDDVADILGPRKFFSDVAEQTDAVGIVTGMAWTPFGGEILFLEARSMPGKGGLKVTGQLGDVMEESVRAAHSWVRGNAERLGISSSAFAENDIHVHVPQGAVRKDGPSAGVAITTALVSLFTARPVRHEVAITGEVTLRGLVLPVGGIKEKVLAAHRAGVATVVLPERNRKDLHDIPTEVLDQLDIKFAKRVDDALAIALLPRCDQSAPGPRSSTGREPSNENLPSATPIAA